MTSALWNEFAKALWESCYMTVLATLLSYVIGLPLGVILATTRKGQINESQSLNNTLGFIVNILRSVPFLILMIAAIPVSRWVLGTSIGSKAAIIPLTIAAFPFVSRMVEGSLNEVDGGVIEAAQSMGASNLQVIWKVMLAEARPSLLNGLTISTTTILSYSAMAGAIGGGGIGAMAINYGYYRYRNDILYISIVILVILVQVVQYLGTRSATLVDHRLK